MEKPIWIKGRSWEANSYVIGNILVDASVSVDKIEPYKNKINTIVLTHGHFDHFANLVAIAKLCGADVYIGEFDLPFLSDESLSLSGHFSRKAAGYPATPLRDGDKVEDFQVYHTPGHTRGGICLFRKADGVLISGDTVFPNGSFGRTDLPTGSHEDMVNSINRLAELDVQSIWPGHETPVPEGGKRHILLSKAELNNYA